MTRLDRGPRRRTSLPRALGRIVPAGVLGAGVLGLGAIAPAHADDTVVITGARESQAVRALAADVVVIDRARIEASAADSLEDLLRREAGVQLSRSGGPGASSGLLIRGASSAQTLVLVDGVRIGAATAGQAEFEGLSLAQIERIEVLRGPGSSLYGADAVGGVVQIVTRGTSATPTLRGRVAAGGLGASELSLDGSAVLGPVQLALGGSQERARGVSALRPGDAFGNYNPDDDGFQRRSLRLSALARPAPGQQIEWRGLASRLETQYDASEFLPPTYAQDASPDFRNRTALAQMSLTWRARWSDAWSTQVQASDQSSDARLGGRVIDRFRTDRRQTVAQATFTAAPGQQWTVALEDLRETARSSAYLADARRDNRAGVLAYAAQWPALSLQAEVRRDDNSVYGVADTSRLGVVVPLRGGWRVRALTGTTFRAPSFNDLVYPGYGVPSLAPERGRSQELGLEWTGPSASVAATVFHNRVRGLIGYEPDAARCPPDPAYSFGCARNVGRARLQGASLSGRWRFGPWTLRGGAEFLDAKDLATGARLPRRAAHQQTLGLRWQDGAWTVGAEALRVGDRPEGSARLPGYGTLDLTASWRVAAGGWIEARLLNAGNRDVEPARDYRGWPRQAWLGLRWESR